MGNCVSNRKHNRKEYSSTPAIKWVEEANDPSNNLLETETDIKENLKDPYAHDHQLPVQEIDSDKGEKEENKEEPLKKSVGTSTTDLQAEVEPNDKKADEDKKNGTTFATADADQKEVEEPNAHIIVEKKANGIKKRVTFALAIADFRAVEERIDRNTMRFERNDLEAPPVGFGSKVPVRNNYFVNDSEQPWKVTGIIYCVKNRMLHFRIVCEIEGIFWSPWTRVNDECPQFRAFVRRVGHWPPRYSSDRRCTCGKTHFHVPEERPTD